MFILVSKNIYFRCSKFLPDSCVVFLKSHILGVFFQQTDLSLAICGQSVCDKIEQGQKVYPGIDKECVSKSRQRPGDLKSYVAHSQREVKGKWTQEKYTDQSVGWERCDSKGC